jgi:PEP-CTERM motif-containing protein
LVLTRTGPKKRPLGSHPGSLERNLKKQSQEPQTHKHFNISGILYASKIFHFFGKHGFPDMQFRKGMEEEGNCIVLHPRGAKKQLSSLFSADWSGWRIAVCQSGAPAMLDVWFPVVGNKKYGGLMRKLFALMIGAFLVCLATAPAAKAGPIDLSMTSVGSTTVFTLSGTYDSNVPTFSFNGVQVSAPNDSYSFSFTLNTAANTNSNFTPDAPDGLFDLSATFSFSLNGGPSMSLGTFMVEFANNNGGNPGGLAFCFDNDSSCTSNTDWIIGGQTLFTGNINNPTFISTPNAQINLDPVMSGFEINGQGPFAFSSTPSPFNPSPTPEPSSIFLLGTGLLGVGFAVRRKLRLV